MADNARSKNNLHGQIHNTPQYIAQAFAACRFLNTDCYTTMYKADPQVSYLTLTMSLIPMNGDSNVLAYGAANHSWEWRREGFKQLQKVLLIGKYRTVWYRIIDLHLYIA